MPGEKIEITAGVGAYSKAAQPQITINGAGQSLDADGKAVYSITAGGAGTTQCTGSGDLYKTRWH